MSRLPISSQDLALPFGPHNERGLIQTGLTHVPRRVIEVYKCQLLSGKRRSVIAYDIPYLQLFTSIPEYM